MKRSFKELLCVALALIMLIGVSACTTPVVTSSPTAASTTVASAAPSEAATAAPIEPVTISMTLGNQVEAATPDNKIYKLIKDKLGVTLVLNFLTGDTKEKLGVMVASGEYPDMMDGAGNGQFMIDNGIFIPLDSMLTKDKTPNLWTYYSPYLKAMANPADGKIYMLQNDGREFNNDKGALPAYGSGGFYLQKDVLIQAGYPAVPQTLDEYFAMIKDYMAKHPEGVDGKPFVGFEIMSDASNWRSFPLTGAWEWLTGTLPDDQWSQAPGFTVDRTTNKVTYDPTVDAAKQYYKTLCQANADGLVDKESFVQNFDEYHAKVASGRVLGMFEEDWQNWVRGTQRAAGHGEREMIPLALSYKAGDPTYYRQPAGITTHDNGLGITVKAKNPEKCLWFIDQLTTEEWQKTLWWGIAGDDYTVGSDGLYTVTDQHMKDLVDKTWQVGNAAVALQSCVPKMLGFYSDGNAMSPQYQLSNYMKGLAPVEQTFLQKYNKANDYQFIPPVGDTKYPVDWPAGAVAFADGSPAAVAFQASKDLQHTWLPKLILASPAEFDAMWAQYQAEFKKIDVTSMEKAAEDFLAAKRAAAK